jgi:prepilin-type N-terminal cleavage/methylation domain-containing protein
MTRSANRAFTLVEVIAVVAIVGIIMLIGIAPLIYSAGLMSETRAAFVEDNRERYVINGIAQDVREIISLGGTSAVRLIHRDDIKGPYDYLMLWTITPSYAMAPVGTVVFGMPPESVLAGDYGEGLYRWLLSDDKRPEAAALEDLEPERGRLILPGVVGVRFSVLDGKNWVDEYTGAMPQALRILIKYDDDSKEEEKTYDVWLPK